MRKLTALFIAAEALWTGLWLGIWEFYPVKPWTDAWRRPVVVATALVGAATLLTAFLLVQTARIEATEHEEEGEATRIWMHWGADVFMQFFAFFLTVEALFNVLSFLRFDIAAYPILEGVRRSIEIGSVIGTVGVMIHLVKSGYEARYVILGASALIAASYVVAMTGPTLQEGAAAQIDALQKAIESGACQQNHIDIKTGRLVTLCAIPMKLELPKP
ncbi:hypothetical protein [Methylocapsa sp. S129]|uniref:hypothetical protein n=1 Tax=Methylocapsa sp. S129 TaxID=1641869 RepID=UPI00131EB0C8|nr:hypothetical protein [Methylocapsa sp. S129]